LTQPLDFQILPQPPVMVSLDGKDPSLLGDAEIYAAWPRPMPGKKTCSLWEFLTVCELENGPFIEDLPIQNGDFQ